MPDDDDGGDGAHGAPHVSVLTETTRRENQRGPDEPALRLSYDDQDLELVTTMLQAPRSFCSRGKESISTESGRVVRSVSVLMRLPTVDHGHQAPRRVWRVPLMTRRDGEVARGLEVRQVGVGPMPVVAHLEHVALTRALFAQVFADCYGAAFARSSMGVDYLRDLLKAMESGESPVSKRRAVDSILTKTYNGRPAVQSDLLARLARALTSHYIVFVEVFAAPGDSIQVEYRFESRISTEPSLRNRVVRRPANWEFCVPLSHRCQSYDFMFTGPRNYRLESARLIEKPPMQPANQSWSGRFRRQRPPKPIRISTSASGDVLVVAAGWGTPDAAVHVSGLPRPSDGTSGPFVGVRFIEPTVGPTLASLSFLLPTLLLFWTVFLPYLSALDRGVPPGHADLTTFAAWFLAVPVALALITKPLQIPDDFYVAPLLARLTLTASGLLSIAMSVVAGGATVWSANAVKRTHGDVRNVAPYILVAVGVLAIWSLLRLIDLATNPFDGGEKRALPVQLWKRLVGLWSTQT